MPLDITDTMRALTSILKYVRLTLLVEGRTGSERYLWNQKVV